MKKSNVLKTIPKQDILISKNILVVTTSRAMKKNKHQVIWPTKNVTRYSDMKAENDAMARENYFFSKEVDSKIWKACYIRIFLKTFSRISFNRFSRGIL